ncbi:putative G-protein coupled receptor Mth-like 3 [Armadillidium nasatum]|uniref:Putative G-protein coupled receptor Mth-like 3 n=1 Tax=Armadillidium nasatum TaxID=96803 RepID=A0A5N5SK03_9CRUS|nr:putative G-protein coupled receptor Mth-like 3 [Armadillidium nasatum]
MMYISFLATFFWLNVLCFELWWKCARQESTTGRRWLWYQIYAWGNPLLLGSIVLSIEFSPYVGPCFLKPNFGIHTCFFSETRTFGSAAKWVYLNGPVAILLITDLVFFLLTVKSLLQTVQQSHKGTVKRQARQRLKLCFKGFIIFLIFILKPKILHAVRERVCSLCCGQHQPRQQLRGRLTFTASVLSEFLSSTKRSHPPLSTHHLSTSSFSTSSPTLSWGSSLSASPATLQKPNKQQNYFYGRPNTASLKKDTNSNTRY